MHLLERQGELDTLNRCLQEARTGCGKLALVMGEAGLGKSSLVEQFLSEHRREARALWGSCDALATPRALGPVHEIAAQAAIFSARGTTDEPRDRLFRALVEELARDGRPCILVIEDVHWADEGTLDFLRYVGRRIQRTSALLLVTYRNNELSRDHPVRLALGELTGRHVIRVRLQPLSTAAIGELARESGRDVASLQQITGGNPFFLRELLASPQENVPETVRDAVLARLARCSAAVRELAELVAVSPGKTDVWLAESILGRRVTVDDAAGGLLATQDETVCFRHELARLAVYSTLALERARGLHQRVLEALVQHGSHPAQLLHHAIHAQNPTAVLEYAPPAAVDAARLGAHREAAAYLSAALPYSTALPTSARAELFERHAEESSLANEPRQAIVSATEALALWRQLQDVPAQSRVLCLVSQEYRTVGEKARADESVADAIALLERLAPSPGLAMAYSARAGLAGNRGWNRDGLDYGQRALALAREFADPAIESHALGNIGSALLGAGDLCGYEPLERSLALALEHGLEERAARAYRLLLFYSVLIHQLDRAEELFRDGIAYSEERGIFVHSAYMRAYYTPAELERGRWTEAAKMATDLLQSTRLTGVQQRITSLVTLALVRVRRGDPGGEELLDEAFALALPSSELNRIGRVVAARAEQAWYRGDLERVAQQTAIGLEHVAEHTAPWIKGELFWWQSRARPGQAIPSDIAEPYRLMLVGEPRRASDAWQKIGMPYEQALALAEGSEADLREALGLLDTLGAGPLAAIVRRRLRERGVRAIPRGRNETTRANPAGLTAREIGVLTLLAEGCSNAQLARRLHRSTKTIENHVSAIFAKLNVRSRTEAVAAAFARGIVQPAKASSATPRAPTA